MGHPGRAPSASQSSVPSNCVRFESLGWYHWSDCTARLLLPFTALEFSSFVRSASIREAFIYLRNKRCPMDACQQESICIRKREISLFIWSSVRNWIASPSTHQMSEAEKSWPNCSGIWGYNSQGGESDGKAMRLSPDVGRSGRQGHPCHSGLYEMRVKISIRSLPCSLSVIRRIYEDVCYDWADVSDKEWNLFYKILH